MTEEHGVQGDRNKARLIGPWEMPHGDVACDVRRGNKGELRSEGFEPMTQYLRVQGQALGLPR